jgi:hypothetical protein
LNWESDAKLSPEIGWSGSHYHPSSIPSGNKEFRTARVNKISVKLLDLQVCHHQYSQLEKNEGLCIQSQPRKDCWVLMHQGNIKNGKEM